MGELGKGLTSVLMESKDYLSQKTIIQIGIQLVSFVCIMNTINIRSGAFNNSTLLVTHIWILNQIIFFLIQMIALALIPHLLL